MIALTAALGITVAPTLSVVPDDYSIAAVTFDIARDSVLGPLRAGLLCLPAGRTRWKDVVLPDNATAITILTRSLTDEQLTVRVSGDPIFADPPPPTRYRIRVTVAAATLQLCKPGSPIGPQLYKGLGTLTVVWETFDRQARSNVVRNVFTVPLVIGKGSATRDTEAVLGALEKAAVLYARTRRRALTD